MALIGEVDNSFFLRRRSTDADAGVAHAPVHDKPSAVNPTRLQSDLIAAGYFAPALGRAGPLKLAAECALRNRPRRNRAKAARMEEGATLPNLPAAPPDAVLAGLPVDDQSDVSRRVMFGSDNASTGSDRSPRPMPYELCRGGLDVRCTDSGRRFLVNSASLLLSALALGASGRPIAEESFFTTRCAASSNARMRPYGAHVRLECLAIRRAGEALAGHRSFVRAGVHGVHA